MRRRSWILSAAGAAGALVVGWCLMPARSRLGSPGAMLPTQGDVALNGWIKIAADGAVVLAMARSEMGQGVHTALAMLAAEELDLPLERVRLEQAGADRIYGNVAMIVAGLPMHPSESEPGARTARLRAAEWIVGKIARELGIVATGGSSSVADAWQPVRLAAATARARLLAAASARWQVPLADLSVRDGLVTSASGRTAHYGELAGAAAGVAPAEVRLKERSQWRLIGRPARRSDSAAKVDGSAQYSADMRPAGLLFAAVCQSPILGATAISIDASEALALPGVHRLVAFDAMAGASAGFAVVGITTWHALRGVAALKAQWQPGAPATPDTRRIASALDAALDQDEGHVFYERGDAAGAQAKAARVISASYSAPYLAHATMEPTNCTARVHDGKVDIWAPTQVPQIARAIAAKVAGVDIDRVQLHLPFLGGGFGRRLEVDFVAQAVRVAMACEGRPVQLMGSREEDMAHDFYRPMQAARLRAGVDADGTVSSLHIKSAGDAINPRWIERSMSALSLPVDMADKATAEGLYDLPYAIANQRMVHLATRMQVPVGFWRSVGHSHNAFFSEAFIDELASETGQDPLALRRSLLKDAPRHLAVLNLAADKAQWGSPLPAGRARGIALHACFGSIVAQVAEVTLHEAQLRVHRVVCAIDCGSVVNPGIVAQQMEGAVVFALSAALYGRIDIHQGVIQQRNFNDYRLVGMAQTPVVETWIVGSDQPPGGVGEPGVPPLAPAVANALFLLTGRRQRALPLQG